MAANTPKDVFLSLYSNTIIGLFISMVFSAPFNTCHSYPSASIFIKSTCCILNESSGLITVSITFLFVSGLGLTLNVNCLCFLFQ